MSKKKSDRIVVGPIHARVLRRREESPTTYWRARIYEDGKERTVWTGWASKSDAQSILAAMVATGDHEPAPIEEEPVEVEELVTVRDLLEVWLAHQTSRAGLKERSVRAYRTCAKRIVRRAGDWKLDEIDEPAMERYASAALREGRGSSTVYNEVTAWRAAWSWAMRLGYIPRETPEPVRVRLPEQRINNDYTPTTAEIRAMLAAVHIPWVRVALAVAWVAGCRVGEVAAIRREHVHPERQMVLVDGKTGRRWVPLPAWTMNALLAHMQTHDRDEVLGVTVKTASTTCNRVMATAQAKAGLPRWTMNGLRRAAVDRAEREGVPVGTAAKLFGHTPKVMLEYYRKANAADLAKASTLLDPLSDGTCSDGHPVPTGARFCPECGVPFTGDRHNSTGTTTQSRQEVPVEAEEPADDL